MFNKLELIIKNVLNFSYFWMQLRQYIIDGTVFIVKKMLGIEALSPKQQRHNMWQSHYQCLVKDFIDTHYDFEWPVKSEVVAQSLDLIGYGDTNKDYSNPYIDQARIEEVATKIALDFTWSEKPQ